MEIICELRAVDKCRRSFCCMKLAMDRIRGCLGHDFGIEEHFVSDLMTTSEGQSLHNDDVGVGGV